MEYRGTSSHGIRITTRRSRRDLPAGRPRNFALMSAYLKSGELPNYLLHRRLTNLTLYVR
jgi:hypothetical protein